MILEQLLTFPEESLRKFTQYILQTNLEITQCADRLKSHGLLTLYFENREIKIIFYYYRVDRYLINEMSDRFAIEIYANKTLNDLNHFDQIDEVIEFLKQAPQIIYSNEN